MNKSRDYTLLRQETEDMLKDEIFGKIAKTTLELLDYIDELERLIEFK